MDVAKFCAAAEKYPAPSAANGTGGPMQFSYGTAGFRTKGDLLASTVFRCGALAAVRSHVTGRTTGIVITASHNPEPDNGVKLVDCTGGMLPLSWETHAEALANADGPDAMKAVLDALLLTGGGGIEAAASLDLHPPPPAGVRADPAPPHVFLARDTRPTGPSLAAAAKAGAEAIAGEGAVTDFGLMTTPQLHYLVYAAYRGLPHAESDYFARLAAGFKTLVASRDQKDKGYGGGTASRGEEAAAAGEAGAGIAVDCANGVGAAKLAMLAAAVGADALPLSLRNTEGSPGSLNNRVGADFVQKEVVAPAHGGFEALPPGTRCVSVDGDSDRLVYFKKKNEQKSGGGGGGDNAVVLFDGDKIAALIATHVADLLARCRTAAASGREGEDEGEGRKPSSSAAAASSVFSPPLRVGVVQTAYANGASTAYVSERLGLETACTPTGVKHLHPKAEAFDVGIYFEANGHGTAVFSDATLAALDAALAAAPAGTDAAAALAELKALTEAINPAVGDALSGILVVEAVLRSKGWGLREWDAMYADLPSRQVKVAVADRGVITTEDAERRTVTPPGMQAAIDVAVKAAGARARAFARPSGTEDVVRVYAEAETREGADALAREVARAVHAHAGGVGDAP